MNIQERLDLYKPFELNPDLSHLTSNEHEILRLLIEAANEMDIPYWIQEFGDPAHLFESISDEATSRYIQINYGPWDRMHNNELFIPGYGEKPMGANFYPADMTTDEFDTAVKANPQLKDPFSMVRRDEHGDLKSIPYHDFFSEHMHLASEKLLEAAKLSDSQTFKKFLELRAQALLTDDYRPSDFAWMDLKDNLLDLLIGPTEVEDRLFGIKTAYTGTIMVKDKEAGKRLSLYIDMLPRFQDSLPLPDQYKREHPGLDSDIQVYDLAHIAGLDACAIPVGVAWPNDEEVQLKKGIRSLLLKNVMRGKFDAVFIPIADLFISSDQHRHVHFNGRFDFVLMHEIAHGLGIKYTKTGNTVWEALGDLAHRFEEAKADLVGLFIANQLNRSGELSDERLIGIYLSSLVSLFYNFDALQSIMRLNYFMESGAYVRDEQSGTYRIQVDQMAETIEKLTRSILEIQIGGDYERAAEFMDQYGKMDKVLESDVERMNSEKIPFGIRLV